MKIGEIDYNLKTPKRSLFLCKPNKSIIAKINEAYDIQYYTKLSTVNELSFKIPTIIIKDDVPMDNPNIERIKHRYIFKYVIGGLTEYFLFNESSKVYSDDEYIEYKALSLGVQLSDKNIREFEHFGNLYDVTKAILDNVYEKHTIAPIERWQVLPQKVDSYFTTSDQANRKYTVGSMSLLEVIYDIAEKWNAVIVWDTINLIIEFKKAENIGLNKGFYIRDGKYLESLDLQIDTSSTITRLKAFGADKLTFAELSPIGANYIQDFSFYMYPFEYNENTGTVIKHSDYMSDELCIAIIKFNKKALSLQGEFERISKKLITLEDILTDEEILLANITGDRVRLENERDLILAEFEPDKEFWGKNGWNAWGKKDGTQPHLDVLARLDAKIQEEKMQQIAVDNARFDVRDAETEKEQHLAKLHHTNNFTIDEWSELQQFVIEKEYTNDSITKPELLLKEAELVFKQNREPAIKLSISIIDFLSVVECQNDWDKLGLGDSIRIRYDRLKVNILAKIIEINYNFEDFSISLTIANEKDLKDGSQQLMDLLSKADITSTIVSLDRDGWNLSKENNGLINDLINNKWDSLKQAVLAGYDQQITINERGIIVKAIDDPNSWLVIQNGFLAITNDGGNTWKHAISKDGIWGEYIFGKVISGVNLYIEDESGAWKTQGARTTIYKARTKNDDGTWSDPEETMWLGLVSDNSRDEYDNVIRQDSGECFGLKSWNNATMVELTNCIGFAISRWGDKYTDDGNYGWEKVLWANTDGTLYARDMVAQSLKIVNDIGEVILDAENNYFNIGLFDTIVADGKLTTIEKLQIITELHKIHRNYKQLLSQADKYIRSTRDDTTDINGAFNTNTQAFGTVDSTTDRFSTAPLKQAYLDLMNYISQYIKIINNGYDAYPLDIDNNDPLTESTSEIADRGEFIAKFRDYYDEAQALAQAIEDSIFYSGIHMGEYYNNLVMNEFGFIAVRNDGMYRAFLNATNGLALQKWERIEGTNHYQWVSKLYATLGDPNWEDGTLVAEGLVTKKLRIWDGEMDKIIFDWYDGITIFGDNATIFLNANDSIKIEDLNGDKKFWVDINGHLFAKDITTHNLKIVDGNLGEKIIFDENDGITIYGNNGGVIYLNANDAIRIAVNGDDKFWVGMDGRLYAKDITTHNLKIVDGNLGEKIIFDHNDGITINGNNGEQIRLNANEGIAIDVNGDKRFWVGTDGNLYAKKLYIQGDDEMIVDVDGSYISDLTVNELKTLNSSSPQDFIHVKDNFIKMKTSYGGAEKDKFTLTVSGSGDTAYPHMTWGAGGQSGSNNNVAYQYKKEDGFYIDYIDSNGAKHEFNLRGSDSAILLKTPNSINIDGQNVNLKASRAITLEVGSNKLIINTDGITLNGSKINLN